MQKNTFINISYRVIIFMILANYCMANPSIKLIQKYEISDTLILKEISLDSVRFYLTEDLSKAENTVIDTAYIQLDGNVYKLPYRVTATTSVVFSGKGQYFRLTGLPLVQEVLLNNYITELFKNPREYLKEQIPAKQWKNSAVYLRYFEPYDKNSLNRTGNKEVKSNNERNELKDFLSDDGDVYVEQNYENFPLPETIDIEVDLRKSPKVVTILNLDFDFDKLDRGFQKLLLDYEKTSKNRIKKSNSEKNY